MLFPYKFLADHGIYKLQELMDELFLEVWCKATPEIIYNEDILSKGVKELFEVCKGGGRKDYFGEPVKEIYEIFQRLNKDEIDLLENAYISNNFIQELCEFTDDISPFYYDQLVSINKELGEKFNEFHNNLYEHVINLKPVEEKTGYFVSHYKDFLGINKNICPFCGMNRIKSKYQSGRESYDHFLPRNKYPFNSINFRNLSPMCRECNERPYKGTKDPLFNQDKKRRKAFYTYCEVERDEIKITIDLGSTDVFNLTPENIKLSFTCPGYEEEVETWLDIFGIEERVKALCLDNTDSKYWLTQILDENSDFDPDQIESEIDRIKETPYFDCNYIKAAFFEGCQKVGAV